YAWSFTTISPAIVSVTPDRNTQFAGPRQPVTVTFNQPMDRASVEAGFRVSPDVAQATSPARVPGTFQWSDADTVLVYTPSERLIGGARYDVGLSAGLKGASGGTSSTPWASSFLTVGEPRVVSTRPAN